LNSNPFEFKWILVWKSGKEIEKGKERERRS
jgi:hypothetical protein